MKLTSSAKLIAWIAGLSGVLFVTSCVDTRKATYFNGINDGTKTVDISVPESIIRKNDILSISVTSLNPEATEIFNNPNTTGGTNGNPGNVTGYFVNSEGNIQFPMLGNIKVEGLTKAQIKESITKKLTERQLLKDPIVSIRLLNFRVTVLGEVKNPTVIPVPNERISLLEAIGLAGDLTIYAKRDNVLVIREESGQKIIKRINLNSNELLNSPYYYLQSDDVVYVEPNKAKVASAGRSVQWLPAVFAAMSLAVVVVDRLVR
ncbi:MAG TPA: polysaccharide biosynthesis/export family protein [Chitinophagaceae bacterium]|nr:polysaccharide biosynthesis/export family protein [Chitinophagaceae bacterium]